MSYTVRIRSQEFLKLAELAGFHSAYGLARAMRVNRSTVVRVLQGELQPGPAFIAGALRALSPMTFEDVFRITEADAPGSAPGEATT